MPRARLDPQLRGGGSAGSTAPTQFKTRQAKTEEGRGPGTICADGRRHSRLPGDPRAGRRGPEAASGARPRHIAQKFNNDLNALGRKLPAPEPLILGPTPRVMESARDGKAKMSKSDASDLSRINLKDSDEEIAAKIPRRRAPIPSQIRRCTDGGAGRAPEASEPDRHLCGAGGKPKAAISISSRARGSRPQGNSRTSQSASRPIRREMAALLTDKAEIDQVLEAGPRRRGHRHADPRRNPQGGWLLEPA